MAQQIIKLKERKALAKIVYSYLVYCLGLYMSLTKTSNPVLQALLFPIKEKKESTQVSSAD